MVVLVVVGTIGVGEGGNAVRYEEREDILELVRGLWIAVTWLALPLIVKRSKERRARRFEVCLLDSERSMT